MLAPNINDYASIEATVKFYIDGAICGSGNIMKPAFHKDATI